MGESPDGAWRLQCRPSRVDAQSVKLRRSTLDRIATAYAEAVAVGDYESAEGWLATAAFVEDRRGPRPSPLRSTSGHQVLGQGPEPRDGPGHDVVARGVEPEPGATFDRRSSSSSKAPRSLTRWTCPRRGHVRREPELMVVHVFTEVAPPWDHQRIRPGSAGTHDRAGSSMTDDDRRLAEQPLSRSTGSTSNPSATPGGVEVPYWMTTRTSGCARPIGRPTPRPDRMGDDRSPPRRARSAVPRSQQRPDQVAPG